MVRRRRRKKEEKVEITLVVYVLSPDFFYQTGPCKVGLTLARIELSLRYLWWNLLNTFADCGLCSLICAFTVSSDLAGFI